MPGPDIPNHVPDFEERTRILFRKFPLPSYAWRREGDDFVLFDYNDASREITAGAIEGIAGKLLSDVYRDDPETMSDIHHCYAKQDVFTKEMEYHFKTVDRTRFLRVTYAFIPPDMVLVFTDDITEQRRTASELEEREKLFKLLLEGISEAVVAVDKSGAIRFHNTAALRMFGAVDDLNGMMIESLVPDDLGPQHRDHRKGFMEDPATREMGGGRYLQAVKRDGSLFPVEIGLSPVRVGDSLYVVAIVTDITERKRAEELLERAARTDLLTGLANRREFNGRFDMEISRFSRTGRPFSIVLSDIDHFKNINDNYGHICGDEVLKMVADKMSGSIRRQDLVGRWGGEEFIILLTETDGEHALRLAEKLRDRIASTAFSCGETVISVTMSFGVAVYDGRLDRDEVIRVADGNLYTAKRSGRNRVV